MKKDSKDFLHGFRKTKENRFDRETFECYMNEVRDLPDNFGDLLQTFISTSKKSQEEVAFEADMSTRNLSRLIKIKTSAKAGNGCCASYIFTFSYCHFTDCSFIWKRYFRS